ncbi:plasmid recombination protein [Anaeropeptidivorans aminofermentans]|uniref:plasmid recombination protein n=1 Tax=Anaeropeptidivorans aminofermentans TaxID=2934315 RepID=UPI002024044B|nr:plasmid recombination protein [Anaeropeptidivorans aminofermentans]
MKRTISVMLGKGSVNHNSRQFKATNIDAERTQLNISYCNMPIKDVYHELFDEALLRYNAKQKRADRCINDYYEKIRTGKQEKLFYEVIFQVGNKENMAAESEDGQLAAKVLDDFMQSFQDRNPHLKVFSAHLHMDEATPHLHVDFVPFITGSKRGLDTRVSLKQALAAQGFIGGTRGDTEWSQWVKSEKEQLSHVMERHGIEWEQLGTHDEHLSVMDYKKVQRSKEVASLEETIEKLQNKQVDVQAVEQIEAKNVPLSSKVMLEKVDYKTLVTAAQKYVVQVKKERKLEKLLQAAEKTIAGLKAKVAELTETISSLTRQLDQYRSVRGQLNVGSLQKENKELKQRNSFYKSIIEQHGLAHLLGRNKDQRQTRDAR